MRWIGYRDIDLRDTTVLGHGELIAHHGWLTAAAIDATHPGLHRQPIPPSGLAGWAWGVLELDAVAVHSEDVLHGDGMALLRQNLASYGRW